MTEKFSPNADSLLHQENQRIADASRRIVAGELGIDPRSYIQGHLVVPHVVAESKSGLSGTDSKLVHYLGELTEGPRTVAAVHKKGKKGQEKLDYEARERENFTTHKVDYSITRPAKRGILRKKPTTEFSVKADLKSDNSTGERTSFYWDTVDVARRGKDGSIRTKTLHNARAQAAMDALDKRAGNLMKTVDPNKKGEARAFSTKPRAFLAPDFSSYSVKDLVVKGEVKRKPAADR